MRRTVTGLSLALSLAAASVVAAEPARGKTALTGQVVQRAADMRDGGGRTHDVYFTDLVTSKRTVRLRLPAKSRRLKTGTTVTVSGDMDGSTMNAATVQVLASAGAPPTTGTTRVLVILAHWSAPDSVTTESARAKIFDEGNRWFAEASFGQLALTGDVTPWVTIPNPGGSCAYSTIMTNAESAASARGFQASTYDRTIVYFPGGAGCYWSGLADVGGRSTWLNGEMTLRTSIHEQGHNYGLYHAHAAYCEGADRLPVTYSAAPDGCGFDEYGDPADVMGGLPAGGHGHFSAAHKHQLGWLGARASEISSCATAVALAPHEDTTASASQAASVAGTGNSRYWFEYRQPTGFDADLPPGITGGVSILLTDPDHGGIQGATSLDATPASEHNHDDRALLPGSSVTLPGDVTVTAGPATATGTTLSLTSPNPSVPRDARVSVASDGGVPVAWSAPECGGSSAVASYTASATSRDGSLDTRTTTSTGLTFQPSEYDRTFRVAAKNATRTGPAVTVPASAPRSIAAGVVMYSDGPETRISWQRPVSNGGRPIWGYRITATPSAGGALQAPYTTTFLYGSMPLTMDTAYDIRVSSLDSYGGTLTTSPAFSFTPRRTTIAFAQAPPHNGWSSAKPVIDLSSNLSDTRFTCELDGSPIACTASPMTLSLTAGFHWFSVYGESPTGGGSASLSRAWQVDAKAPVAILASPTTSFTMSTSVGARWSATDPQPSGAAGSGVASYDVRYRVAPWNGAFGSLVYPSTWQKTTATTKSVAATAGSTYCFSVRARDKVGNVSGWTAERCTARVLDDAALTAASGWRRYTGNSAYYLGTMTRSTAASASLSRSGAQVARVAVVATRCPTCGSVRVYVGTTLIGTISLYASTTQQRVVIPLPKRAVVTGSVTFRTVTAGKVVEIDGMGISRA